MLLLTLGKRRIAWYNTVYPVGYKGIVVMFGDWKEACSKPVEGTEK